MTSSAAWNLRFKRPQENPFIGKFSAKANFDQAVPPIRMSLQAEELREEINDEEVVKDADYYKKKKQKKRRKYTKQSKLVIEDSSRASIGSDIGIGRFEGQLVDLSLNESLYTSQTNKSESQEGSFRYALLEVVAAANTESKQTEVNVIPIHDMFYFRRPALTGDKLLDEIDDDYDEKMRKDKLKMQRYRRIGRALEEIEGRGSGTQDASATDDNEAGSSAQGKSFDIPALFGSISKKSKGRGPGGGGGGRKAIEASNSGLVDEDQMRELGSEYTGDYRVQFVDDEEDNVVHEQNFLNAVEEDYTAQRDTVVDMEEDYENESDEEEEEEDQSSSPPAGVVLTAPSTSIAGINKEDFDSSARIARELLIQNSKKRSRDVMATASTYQAQLQASALQRPATTDAPKAIAKAASSSKIAGSDSEPMGTDSSSEKYEFSEAGLLAFMQAMGGRTSTAAVKEVPAH
jgi:hypothetical protein